MTNIKISNVRFQIVDSLFMVPIIGLLASTALAGARIDLRPTPPQPPQGYEPNTIVRVDVYFVDTGNPQGNILFRGFFLNAIDTLQAGDLSFELTGSDYCCCLSAFDLLLPSTCPLCLECPNMPDYWVYWIWPLSTPNPLFMFFLPNDGELHLGNFEINVGMQGGVLDVMNADEPDPMYGTWAGFGFGSAPDDPVVFWSAYNGDLTGGRLEIMVNSGTQAQIVFSDPPHNAIDARQPTDIDGLSEYGWQEFDLVFTSPIETVEADDFEITQQGGDDTPPTVSEVTIPTLKSIHVSLSEPISPGAWTTLTYLPSGSNIRVGFLPGDASGNGTSSPQDILALINALNEVTPLPIHSMDINRSGVAGPTDILRLIDLLNGAGVFDVWNGVSLP